MNMSRALWTCRQCRRATTARRRYWTACTIEAPSSANLLDRLKSRIQAYQSPPSALLFALSKDLPPEALTAAVTYLRAATPEPIGCLSDAIPGTDSSPRFGISLAAWVPDAQRDGGVSVVPFTSTVAARPSIQLGREILPSKEREKDEVGLSRLAVEGASGKPRWSDMWALDNPRGEVPEALQDLK